MQHALAKTSTQNCGCKDETSGTKGRRWLCGVFSILKLPPRVLSYIQHQVLFREKCRLESTKGWWASHFCNIRENKGKPLRGADISVLALPNLLLVFQILRHVERTLSSQIFLIEAPWYQTNRPIYLWLFAKKKRGNRGHMETRLVFSIYDDRYVRWYRRMQVHDECFSPFAFIATSRYISTIGFSR